MWRHLHDIGAERLEAANAHRDGNARYDLGYGSDVRRCQ